MEENTKKAVLEVLRLQEHKLDKVFGDETILLSIRVKADSLSLNITKLREKIETGEKLKKSEKLFVVNSFAEISRDLSDQTRNLPTIELREIAQEKLDILFKEWQKFEN